MISCKKLLAIFIALSLSFSLVHAQDDASVPTTPAAPGKPSSRMITLSDFGAEDLAYLAVPAQPPTVGIVLVPDAYGLDAFTKAEADALAAKGYLVVAVDIYNGHATTDPGALANLVANMNADSVMKTVNSGIRLFRESPKFRVDHVVAMGWGAGATFVFQAAREEKNLDGAITFYGPVETRSERVGKFTTPLCAVYPDNDPVATHESVVTFQQLMKAAGNDFEAWFIAAGSGWSNPSSKNYNPAEDKEAWKVTLPFLVRISALPPKIQKSPNVIDKAKNAFENFFK